MEVADRIVVMNKGRIEQDGPPDEVYDHPATPFVLQFLGDVNLFHGRIGPPSAAGAGGGAGASAGAGADAGVDAGVDAGAPGEISFVRPHELDVVGAAEPGAIEATLVQALTVGPNTRLEFRRRSDQSFVEVEMARADWTILRDRLRLATGATAFLLPRKVTRFSSEDVDPAAMI